MLAISYVWTLIFFLKLALEIILWTIKVENLLPSSWRSCLHAYPIVMIVWGGLQCSKELQSTVLKPFLKINNSLKWKWHVTASWMLLWQPDSPIDSYRLRYRTRFFFIYIYKICIYQHEIRDNFVQFFLKSYFEIYE